MDWSKREGMDEEERWFYDQGYQDGLKAAEKRGKERRMRLIDADALMQEFANFVRRSKNSDFAPVPSWNDAVSLLGSAPTVDTEELLFWRLTEDTTTQKRS